MEQAPEVTWKTERKVDTRFADHELERFRQDFREYMTQQSRHMEELAKANRDNAETISQLREETRDIINLYNNLSGTAAVGIAVQNFGLWVIKWPLIGAGIYTLYKWLTKHFP